MIGCFVAAFYFSQVARFFLISGLCGIHLLLRGQDVLPFLYEDLGNMATIGRNAAVVHMGSVQLQGFTAWLFWSFVHILRLIDFRNRFIVFAKWVWDYFVYDRTVRIITRQ